MDSDFAFLSRRGFLGAAAGLALANSPLAAEELPHCQPPRRTWTRRRKGWLS